MIFEKPSSPESLSQGRVVRFRTLTRLRWFAIAGQVLVILGVRLGLGYEVPIGAFLVAVAVSVWFNVHTLLTRPPAQQMDASVLMRQLCFDACQISTVLFLTGGVQNPFAVWLILPAMLAAAALPRERAAVVIGVVVLAITVLTFWAFPLPGPAAAISQLPIVYDLGKWLAYVLGTLFTALYAHTIAASQAKIATALSAAQQALAREEKVTALGGLAAVAAHELGTPLATIQVTAREMEQELPEGPLKEDASLLVSQTQRCQSILRRLSNLGDTPDARHNRLSLDDIMREAARPFLEAKGPEVSLILHPDSTSALPDDLLRQPEVIYGLRTLIENGHKYAVSSLSMTARWTATSATIMIDDDGPGFAPDVLLRLGEPYPRQDGVRAGEGKKGLGLGFFIAKTLLERTGADIRFGNEGRLSGAWVEVSWPLEKLRSSPISSPTT